MIVINPTDLRANQGKYFDLAQTEQVFIKRGQQLIELVVHPYGITEEDLTNGISGKLLIEEVAANVRIFPDKERLLRPDADLARAITMDELLIGVKEDLKEIFSQSSK